MPRIGITGHSNLSVDSVALIYDAIVDAIRGIPGDDLIGFTCLARGADQLFAHAVLDLGGKLNVVLPAQDYRERKVKPDNAHEFDELIGKAHRIETLDFPCSNREAYLAASEAILADVDKLIAVWDGSPSAGIGGTADVVRAAQNRGLPIIVIWPPGVHREM